jgi:hypothetical protein
MTEDPDKKAAVDFYGVVTFEVKVKDIGGMEYSNMLIENSSRIVFEGKSITKRSFANVQDFFNFYALEKRNTDAKPYTPQMDHINQRIEINRVYPFVINENP